jgi:KaiC
MIRREFLKAAGALPLIGHLFREEGVAEEIATPLPIVEVPAAPLSIPEVPPDSGRRISTGFPVLDEALGGGLRPGELMVVAGPVGTGKTTLAKFIAQRTAILGGSNVFLNHPATPEFVYKSLLGHWEADCEVWGDSDLFIIDEMKFGAQTPQERVGNIAMFFRWLHSNQVAAVVTKATNRGFDFSGRLDRKHIRYGLPVFLQYMAAVVMVAEEPVRNVTSPGNLNYYRYRVIKNRYGPKGWFWFVGIAEGRCYPDVTTPYHGFLTEE